MKISALILNIAITLSLRAQADANLKIGEPSYKGTGCAAGTAAITVLDQSVSPLFLNDFKMSTRKGVVLKSCSLAIPLEVPAGMQVAVGPIGEVKGFVSLPNSSAKLTLRQESFFVGQRGAVLVDTRKGLNVGDLSVVRDVSLKDLRWSPCGQSTLLRVNFTAVIENTSRKLAFASIEALDLLKNGHLYWRNCR